MTARSIQKKKISSLGSGVGQTCLLIAAWRAFESEQVDPLYSDPLANIFVDDSTRSVTKEMGELSSASQHLINFRTYFFDNALKQAIREGVRQVLILGAGLDTRSSRIPHDGVTFYEIDQKEVIRFKQRQFKRFGYTPKSKYIAANYINADFIGMLLKRGFSKSEKTFIIWEGNSMYIPEDKIHCLLQKLHETLREFKLSFDYLSAQLIQNDASLVSAKEIFQRFDAMDAPWITGFEDIKALAEQANMKLIENKSLVKVVEAIESISFLNSDLFQHHLVATLTSSKE